MEYTKGEQKVRDKIRDKVAYNGAGMMSATYADAIMEIPEVRTTPALYEALGTIKRTAESGGAMLAMRNVLKTVARLAREALAQADKGE